MTHPVDYPVSIVRSAGTYTLVIGALMMALGIVGIFAPGAVAVGAVVVIAWVLLIGAGFWAYHTWLYRPRSPIDWLKPVLLFVTGVLMLTRPEAGVAVIGLLLAFYLLLDSFGSFALARKLHPLPGWGWMTLNGVLSLLLALLLLIGWPEQTIWLVGIYVGISLFFDGWVLAILGWHVRRDAST